MTPDTWHLTHDTWRMTHDTLHVTPDMWHLTQDLYIFVCPFLSLSVCFGVGATIHTRQEIQCLLHARFLMNQAQALIISLFQMYHNIFFVLFIFISTPNKFFSLTLIISPRNSLGPFKGQKLSKHNDLITNKLMIVNVSNVRDTTLSQLNVTITVYLEHIPWTWQKV